MCDESHLPTEMPVLVAKSEYESCDLQLQLNLKFKTDYAENSGWHSHWLLWRSHLENWILPIIANPWNHNLPLVVWLLWLGG